MNKKEGTAKRFDKKIMINIFIKGKACAKNLGSLLIGVKMDKSLTTRPKKLEECMKAYHFKWREV